MARRLLLAAILAGLVIALEAQSPPPPPSPSESSKKDQYGSRDNQSNAKVPNSTAQTIPTSTNQAATQPAKTNVNAKGTPKRDKSPINWWVVLNAALLTVFNGALAWIGWKQYHGMRQQIEIAKISADAAKQSADAAMDAIAHAKNSTAVTERAVILIDSVVAEPQIGPTAPYFSANSVLIFTLKNFGSTVAHEVRAKGNVYYPGGVRIFSDNASSTIAPQGSNEWITDPIFPNSSKRDNQILIANKGEGIVRYDIEVTYEDAFKETHVYKAEGLYIIISKAFTIMGSTSD